jgi:hypothetical protein
VGLLRLEIYTSDVFYGGIKQESSIIIFSRFIPPGCRAAAIKYSIDWLWRRHSGCTLQKDLHVTRASLLAEIASGDETFSRTANYFKSFLITTKQDTTTRGEIFPSQGCSVWFFRTRKAIGLRRADVFAKPRRSGKIHLENEILRSNPTPHTRASRRALATPFLSHEWRPRKMIFRLEVILHVVGAVI